MSSATEYWTRPGQSDKVLQMQLDRKSLFDFDINGWSQFLLLSPHTYSVESQGSQREELKKMKVSCFTGRWGGGGGGMMEPICVWAWLSSHYWADNARREEGLETRQNTIMARVFIFYVRLSDLSPVVSLSLYSHHLDLLCLPAQSPGRRQVGCCCW